MELNNTEVLRGFLEQEKTSNSLQIVSTKDGNVYWLDDKSSYQEIMEEHSLTVEQVAYVGRLTKTTGIKGEELILCPAGSELDDYYYDRVEEMWVYLKLFNFFLTLELELKFSTVMS